MSLFEFKKRQPQPSIVEFLKLKQEIKGLTFRLQSFTDAMTGEETASPYGTNNYRNYALAVKAVNDKYENQSSWGNGLTANIIDFRAAVTVSSGPQYKPATQSTIKQKDDEGENIGGQNGKDADKIQAFKAEQESAQAEMDFCRSFFEFNDINHETPQDWGREAEIEGRCAVELKWDEEQKQVIAMHVPWSTYKYTEIKSKVDREAIDGIKWDAVESEKIDAGELKGDNVVCRRFSGRTSAKYPITKVMRVLTQIEYVDQAFRDWREINRLYASPIPIFECATAEEAEEMQAQLAGGLNFKIKKAFVVRGKFVFVGPDMSGIDSMEREIKRQACFISGTTGYPLQFLLPDMLSNRSTSENIMESAMIHTASEREIWKGFYEELVTKAMAMYTEKTSKKPLDPNKIAISISLMTAEQWNRLTSFWLPAYREDLVTREAALSEIPNFNIQAELDRREEKDGGRIADITRELDTIDRERPMDTPVISDGIDAVPAGEKVADTSLNGAQISSMVEILSSAADGTIPVEAVLPLLNAAFPNTDPGLISRMAASVTQFAKKKATEKKTNEAALPLEMKSRFAANGNNQAGNFPPKGIPGDGQEA